MTDTDNLKQLISDVNLAKIALKGAKEAHETSEVVLKAARRNYYKATGTLVDVMDENGWGCIKLDSFIVYRDGRSVNLRLVPIDHVMEYEWKE